MYLLPSLFTLGNMFCGYACIVYAMRGEFETAAPFIGFAIVLDMLDGRIARLTGTASDFGVEFDSLADVISFGIAPAILSFAWGLSPLGRLGWAAGFMFLTAAAMRLARFNIQSAAGGDKRYFVGMPSPAAAAIPAATVFAYPWGLYDYRAALPALADGARARDPDGQHDPLPQLQDDRPAEPPSVHRAALIAAGIVLIATHPRFVLVVLAYSYLASAFIGMAITRLSGIGSTRAVVSPTRPERTERAPRSFAPQCPPDPQLPDLEFDATTSGSERTSLRDESTSPRDESISRLDESTSPLDESTTPRVARAGSHDERTLLHAATELVHPIDRFLCNDLCLCTQRPRLSA